MFILKQTKSLKTSLTSEDDCWLDRILDLKNTNWKNLLHAEYVGNLRLISRKSQPAIICSELPIKTLEQGMKYVQSYQ